MTVRTFQRVFAPDTGASGAPPAAAPPAAGAPPATPPAPPAPASDEAPAWAKALRDELNELKGAKTKAEADTSAATAAKLTVEQQMAADRAEFSKFREQANRDKVKVAVAEVARGVSFASPAFAEAGLAVFEANHKLEVSPDGKVIATGADGKPQHLVHAFDAWKKAQGAAFIAAPAQPGPGGVGAAPAMGDVGLTKHPKDMTDEEFFNCWKSGKTPDGKPIRGQLTPGSRGAPVFEFQSQQNPFAGSRAAVNAAFKALAQKRHN